MKKLIFAIAALILLSCSKEDGSKNIPIRERIVGSWNGVESVAVFLLPTGEQSIKNDLSYLAIEFIDDGTFISDSLGIPLDSGLWSLPDVSTFVLDSITFDIELISETYFYFGIDTAVTQGGNSVNVKQTTKLAK